MGYMSCLTKSMILLILKLLYEENGESTGFVATMGYV